jgi:hypothetical protein
MLIARSYLSHFDVARENENAMSLSNPLGRTVTILTRRHTGDIHFSSKLPGNFHPRGQGKTEFQFVLGHRALPFLAICLP